MRRLPWTRRSELSRESESPSLLRRFREEMDRLFDAFITEPWETVRGGVRWMPEVDVVEEEGEIVVRAELPGMDAKDVEVTVSGGMLVISGEKKEETEEKERNFYRSERRWGAFRREIPLPEGADPDKVTAEYDKGILYVRIGKTAAATRKRIPIKENKSEGRA